MCSRFDQRLRPGRKAGSLAGKYVDPRDAQNWILTLSLSVRKTNVLAPPMRMRGEFSQIMLPHSLQISYMTFSHDRPRLASDLANVRNVPASLQRPQHVREFAPRPQLAILAERSPKFKKFKSTRVKPMACAKLRATHLKLCQRVLFWLKTRGPLLAQVFVRTPAWLGPYSSCLSPNRHVTTSLWTKEGRQRVSHSPACAGASLQADILIPVSR